MKHKTYLLLLFIVGIINFLPIIGLFSATQISQAYDINLASIELEVLMRHRALLFGTLGGFVFYSLVKPNLRVPAMFMTGVSMVGFIYLAWSIGDINDALIKIVWADIVGILCLLMAVFMRHLLKNETI